MKVTSKWLNMEVKICRLKGLSSKCSKTKLITTTNFFLHVRTMEQSISMTLAPSLRPHMMSITLADQTTMIRFILPIQNILVLWEKFSKKKRAYLVSFKNKKLNYKTLFHNNLRQSLVTKSLEEQGSAISSSRHSLQVESLIKRQQTHQVRAKTILKSVVKFSW
jgi:hypothetical protein